MVGEEIVMTESIVIGLVVGGGVAVVGALVGHFLRRREMQAQWDKEERRLKSERRRDLYERELRTVSDTVDAIVRAMAEVGNWDMKAMFGKRGRNSYDNLIGEVDVMWSRGRVVTDSLGDEELIERYDELVDCFGGWSGLLSRVIRDAREGKEEDLDDWRGPTERAASEVWRRIREMLEEV